MSRTLIIPTRWSALKPQELRDLLDVMASAAEVNNNTPFRTADDYSSQTFARVAMRCALRWNKVKVVCRYGDGWLLQQGSQQYPVTAAGCLKVVQTMEWARHIPPEPVRLDSIGSAKAVDAYAVNELSFENYLACENYWQLFSAAANGRYDSSLLREMAVILYGSDSIEPTPGELLGVFYWWASLKAWLGSMFSNFYRPATGTASVDGDSLRRGVDAQIRALTKGDITKEPTVLALPAIRAITELDALAREYEELNRKYSNNNVRK
jgi:hypothetical protein